MSQHKNPYIQNIIRIKYYHFKITSICLIVSLSFQFKLFPLPVKSLKYDINIVLIPNICHTSLLLSQRSCQDIEIKWNFCEHWFLRIWALKLSLAITALNFLTPFSYGPCQWAAPVPLSWEAASCFSFDVLIPGLDECTFHKKLKWLRILCLKWESRHGRRSIIKMRGWKQ